MFRKQIYLTEHEKEQLLQLSKELGKPQNVLIREALDQFIAKKLKLRKQKHQALRRASGIWANRDDLPNFTNLRKELTPQTN